jgi:hypothetical protein
LIEIFLFSHLCNNKGTGRKGIASGEEEEGVMSQFGGIGGTEKGKDGGIGWGFQGANGSEHILLVQGGALHQLASGEIVPYYSDAYGVLFIEVRPGSAPAESLDSHSAVAGKEIKKMGVCHIRREDAKKGSFDPRRERAGGWAASGLQNQPFLFSSQNSHIQL